MVGRTFHVITRVVESVTAVVHSMDRVGVTGERVAQSRALVGATAVRVAHSICRVGVTGVRTTHVVARDAEARAPVDQSRTRLVLTETVDEATFQDVRRVHVSELATPQRPTRVVEIEESTRHVVARVEATVARATHVVDRDGTTAANTAQDAARVVLTGVPDEGVATSQNVARLAPTGDVAGLIGIETYA